MKDVVLHQFFYCRGNLRNQVGQFILSLVPEDAIFVSHLAESEQIALTQRIQQHLKLIIELDKMLGLHLEILILHYLHYPLHLLFLLGVLPRVAQVLQGELLFRADVYHVVDGAEPAFA